MEATFALHHFLPLSPSLQSEVGGGGRRAEEGRGWLTQSGCKTKMAAQTFCLLSLVLLVVSGAEYEAVSGKATQCAAQTARMSQSNLAHLISISLT